MHSKIFGKYDKADPNNVFQNPPSDSLGVKNPSLDFIKETH